MKLITLSHVLSALLGGILLLSGSALYKKLTPYIPTVTEFPEFPAPVTSLGEKDRGTVFYKTRSPFDLDVILADFSSARETTGVGYLTLPEQASRGNPAAAMIILHGSGGISPGREFGYAKLLAQQGIASFIVDYYLPRGVTPKTPYMTATTNVTDFDVVTDAYSALKLLSTHPLIDSERIGVMGFSYGGMATRYAMDERFRQIMAPGHKGFAAHVDYYGPCFQIIGTEKTNGAPLLSLRGTEDKSVTIADCKKREAELRELGVEVTDVVYPGAGHAWDGGYPLDTYPNPYVAGCDLVYDKNGIPAVNGKPVIDVAGNPSREQRIRERMGLGIAMMQCVGQGYLMGWDPDTREKSDRELLQFLNKHL